MKHLNFLKWSLAIIFFSINGITADLPVIGITEISSGVDSRGYYEYKNSKAANFQTMLETQMVKVGRFKIMERNRLEEVLSEQGLQGEFSNLNTITKIKAVDYLVYGAVTKFGSKKKRISTGKFTSFKLISEFGVDLKIVDVASGEIRRAETIEVSMETAAGISSKGIQTGDTLADPLSDIQRRAAKQAAAAISESIFPIEVVTFKEDGDKNCCTYLNYGEALLSIGDRLNIVLKGESLIDETSGLDLGSTEKIIGVVEIIESLEKFSKAKIISGDIPSKGQLARIIKDKTGLKTKNSKKQRTKIGREI